MGSAAPSQCVQAFSTLEHASEGLLATKSQSWCEGTGTNFAQK